jgi:hypothetical protein
MACVQVGSIGDFMRNGEQVFEERTGAEGERKVVRRDARLADNSLLPEAYALRMGDRLFASLRDGFEEESFGGPPACPAADFDCAIEGVRRLLALFVARGFAFSGTVTEVDEAGLRFRARLEGPATLYAAAELASRRSAPPPAFAEYALAGFLRASGWTPSCTTRASRSAFDMEWELRRA